MAAIAEPSSTKRRIKPSGAASLSALKREERVTVHFLRPLRQRAHNQDLQHAACAGLGLRIRQQPIQQLHRLREPGTGLGNPDPRQNQLLRFAREAEISGSVEAIRIRPGDGGSEVAVRQGELRLHRGSARDQVGDKPALAGHGGVGFECPLCGGVVSARVLQACKSQIAECHILSVDHLPVLDLLDCLGQVLLRRLEVIPLVQHRAHAGVISRAFEQQRLVGLGRDLGHLAIGGGRRAKPALQHLQPSQVGDRRQPP
jgi:hypothetical protein